MDKKKADEQIDTKTFFNLSGQKNKKKLISRDGDMHKSGEC